LKRRLVKKFVKNLSDNELFEHVAYTENKRFRRILEKEFDARFGESLKQEKQLAEDLMGISYEVDELMKTF
jgi:hypothetical protein